MIFTLLLTMGLNIAALNWFYPGNSRPTPLTPRPLHSPRASVRGRTSCQCTMSQRALPSITPRSPVSHFIRRGLRSADALLVPFGHVPLGQRSIRHDTAALGMFMHYWLSQLTTNFIRRGLRSADGLFPPISSAMLHPVLSCTSTLCFATLCFADLISFAAGLRLCGRTFNQRHSGLNTAWYPTFELGRSDLVPTSQISFAAGLGSYATTSSSLHTGRLAAQSRHETERNTYENENAIRSSTWFRGGAC